jgi:hypothetical protein
MVSYLRPRKGYANKHYNIIKPNHKELMMMIMMIIATYNFYECLSVIPAREVLLHHFIIK